MTRREEKKKIYDEEIIQSNRTLRSKTQKEKNDKRCVFTVAQCISLKKEDNWVGRC